MQGYLTLATGTPFYLESATNQILAPSHLRSVTPAKAGVQGSHRLALHSLRSDSGVRRNDGLNIVANQANF
ncbi:MAG: hypothetical protein Q7S85_11630 [Rugosibacter sp.]|nr:hypothetical protein [Rugosibacter sp.]